MSSAPITVILSRDLSRETQGKCQSRDRGEAPRHATCVQELPTRFYPPMMIWWYPKVTFLHFKRRVLWPDESMTNPLKSRQFQTHFKTIKRCFQEFKMDQFKDGPCHRVRRISPFWFGFGRGELFFKRRALWPCAKDQPAWRRRLFFRFILRLSERQSKRMKNNDRMIPKDDDSIF